MELPGVSDMVDIAMCQKNSFQICWSLLEGIGDISKDFLCFPRHACIDECQFWAIDEIAMSGNAVYYMYSWDNLHDAPPGDSR
jgi:hypothetical protein